MIKQKNTFKNFDWIIKILKSSKNVSHMECVRECFFLWEKMHISEKIEDQELKIINKLRSTFWAHFKNKYNEINTSFNF